MGENAIPEQELLNRLYIGKTKTGDNIDAIRVGTYVWDGTNWQRATQSSEVPNEVLTGIKNGVNVTFSTFYAFKPLTTKLYVNGLRYAEGVGLDYLENVDNQTITMAAAPLITDSLIIDYYKL